MIAEFGYGKIFGGVKSDDIPVPTVRGQKSAKF